MAAPHWPEPPRPPAGTPNILVVLFDDVGFSDFGCYGSAIRTPHIDALANRGLRYSGFHTTAMCSTTRAALLTGRNHHSVGMGCLANFDSGYPGYRGKISREAGTLAEMLRPVGFRNYMLGKWHVTPLTQSGPTGPFDGWPLGRGFDRFYGFMDAETDQYAPELVRDNTHVDAPGSFASGYHLTADLVDEAIRMIADHTADAAGTPWLTWLALGACHAPHQAPAELIRQYDAIFAHGWDAERERRLIRQKALGLVPADTRLPPRNDGVAAWDSLGADEQTRLHPAAGSLCSDARPRRPAHRPAGRLASGFGSARQHAGAGAVGQRRQPGGRTAGHGQCDGALQLQARADGREDPAHRRHRRAGHTFQFPARLGDGLEHAAAPLQAEHAWRRHSRPADHQLAAGHRGAWRSAAAVLPCGGPGADAAATAEAWSRRRRCRAWRRCRIEGESFAASLHDAKAPPRRKPQYFEMFGHRGLWHEGWKAVAFHPPGTPFDGDRWELYHLDHDFSEVRDLAAEQPERLKALVDRWWAEAEAHQVLPLDDRFGPRFVESTRRYHGPRRRFVFHAGVGHIPSDVAPDVRGRGYRIEAEVFIDKPDAQGVLIAHGDATSGYSLFVRNGQLVHDMNIGGQHHVIESDRPVPQGHCKLGYEVQAGPLVPVPPPPAPMAAMLPAWREGTLLIDGQPAGSLKTQAGFNNFISWSGLDIGRDRGSAVSTLYAVPFGFSGRLKRITVTLDAPQGLDGEAVAQAEMARQ